MTVASDRQIQTFVQRRKDRAKRHRTTIRKRTYDTFGTLPVELQVMCWEYLPANDVCKLALVCTHWRDVSARYPQLWNQLRLDHIPADPQSLFARSRDLKILLTVSLRTVSDWIRLPSCLRLVALRLYELRLVLAFNKEHLPHGACSPEQLVTQNLFRYPAPVLIHLSISTHTSPLFLPEDAFGGYAPNLRSVNLHNVILPRRCPAMRTVQTVWIGSRFLCNQRYLFDVFPSIVRLGIDNLEDWEKEPFLPPIPPGSQLSECEFLNDGCDNEALDRSLVDMSHRGYLELPNVTLRSPSSGMIEFFMTDAIDWHTLTINGDCSAHLRVYSDHDKYKLNAYAEAIDVKLFQRFLEVESHTTNIQHLILPQYLPGSTPLVAHSIALPRLLTLAITCGEPSHYVHSLLDPHSGFGIISAPLLAKLEIRRADGFIGEIQPLDPEHIADFIENCLDCNNSVDLDGSKSEHGNSSRCLDLERPDAMDIDGPSDEDSQRLELFLDVANGVRLLGRTTLPLYLLSQDPLGHFVFRYD